MTQNKKLSWTEIKRDYDQEWVLLDEFDWPTGQPYPSSGAIICHSADKRTFDKMAIEDDTPHVARVFVGKPQIPQNTVINCNMFKMTVCS